MSKLLKILTVVGLGVATVSCGSSGGSSSDSIDEFCSLLEDVAQEGRDPTDEDDLDEILDLLDELSDLAPDELQDAIGTIRDAAEAISDNDLEEFDDPDFAEEVDDATNALDEFAEDDCEIDLDEEDPDDTDGPDDTEAPDDTQQPDDTGSPGDTAAPVDSTTTDTEDPPSGSDDAVVVSEAGIAFHTSYDEPQASWAALITNEGDLIAEFVEIQVTFRDADGTVVGTDEAYLSEIGPGETRAVGSDYVDDVPETAVSVDAVVDTSEFRSADENPVSITFSNVSLTPTDSGVRVLAEASATAASTVESPAVVAVFRDASGVIIGGTSSYIGFVPVGSAVGVEVSTSLELPAGTTAELYADSFTYSFDDEPAGTEVAVVDSGFSSFDSFGTLQGTWAAIVSNPNADLAASYISLIATFRDTAGAIVAVAQESITAMAPASQSAYGSDFVYDLPESAATMTVVAHASSFVDELASGTFTATGTASVGEFGLTVMGEVVSTFANNVDYVDVVAVFRDASGAIIGGSVEYLDFVPANSSIGYTLESSIQRSDPVTAEVFVDYGGAYDE